jgi:DNA-binding transcriptional ArsR family regulator
LVNATLATWGDRKVDMGRSPSAGAFKVRESASGTEAKRTVGRRTQPSRSWTLLTIHAQVLLVVTRNPDLRVSEIARITQISVRYAYRVLNDLQEAGYVDRGRHGRRNMYSIDADLVLGDPVVEEQSLRELLGLIGQPSSPDPLEPISEPRPAA